MEYKFNFYAEELQPDSAALLEVTCFISGNSEGEPEIEIIELYDLKQGHEVKLEDLSTQDKHSLNQALESHFDAMHQAWASQPARTWEPEHE